jgi:glycine/D-amino acid oxidase-like deaminating enzyme
MLIEERVQFFMLQVHTSIGLEPLHDWESKSAGRTEPSWFEDSSSLEFRKLNRNISVDVVIVGGGIAGLTTGYLLTKNGKRVAVVDDGNLASGETGRTTAHITHALDDRYYELEKTHGKKGARLAAESHTAAIDRIESIVRNEGIDCNFERLDGYLFLDPTDNDKSILRELEATHRAGIAAKRTDSPLQSFDGTPCIRFPDQAQFQPLRYIAGLARAITRNGGLVFTETHVQEVTGHGAKTDDGHKIEAKAIVVATNAPIVDKISKLYDKQVAYRTYVIGAQIGKGLVQKALYWDTGDHKAKNVVPPYHYVRIQELKDKDFDMLIVGGEDQQTGNIDNSDERYQSLYSWAKEHFPIGDITYRWSGQVMEPKDGLAFIGRNPWNHCGNDLDGQDHGEEESMGSPL